MTFSKFPFVLAFFLIISSHGSNGSILFLSDTMEKAVKLVEPNALTLQIGDIKEEVAASSSYYVEKKSQKRPYSPFENYMARFFWGKKLRKPFLALLPKKVGITIYKLNSESLKAYTKKLIAKNKKPKTRELYKLYDKAEKIVIRHDELSKKTIYLALESKERDLFLNPLPDYLFDCPAFKAIPRHFWLLVTLVGFLIGTSLCWVGFSLYKKKKSKVKGLQKEEKVEKKEPLRKK